MFTSLTDLLVYTPAILILIGVALTIRKQKHWSPWITAVGAILILLSWAIKLKAWHGDVMVDHPDMSAETQIQWLGISSTVFLAGWCVISVGYLMQSFFGNRK